MIKLRGATIDFPTQSAYAVAHKAQTHWSWALQTLCTTRAVVARQMNRRLAMSLTSQVKSFFPVQLAIKQIPIQLRPQFHTSYRISFHLRAVGPQLNNRRISCQLRSVGPAVSSQLHVRHRISFELRTVELKLRECLRTSFIQMHLLHMLTLPMATL